MYCDYFGFKERPFTIAPNPKYLYMSERHREALAHLVFGVGESGGFVLLTGEVGTGKTTVCRCLLEQLPNQTDIAFILNPKLSAIELLQTICDDLGLKYGNEVTEVTIKQLNDALNTHLLDAHAQGRHTILLIDEAQNLSPEVLEQIRLLTNLETNEKKLLQIILIGQPELKTILGKTELRQLSQRITARYHLDPLTLEETSGYIRYRMAVAGNEAMIFNTQAVEAIHRISQGVPRLINTICDRSLLGAYSRNQKRVEAVLVKQAALEVLGEKGKATTAEVTKSKTNWTMIFSGIGLLVIGVLAGQWLPTLFQEQQAPTPVQVIQPKIEPITELENKVERMENKASQSLLPEMTMLANTAQQQLFSQWDVNNVRSCSELKDVGLECSEHQGSWGQLLSSNRPAILTVILNGERTFVNVVGANGSEAILLKNGLQKTIFINEILPVWNGEYSIVWKPPISYTRPIQIQDSGEQVQWLVKRLLQIMQPEFADEIIIPKTMRFDEAMKLQLSDFQKEQGLRVDGVAGQQTLMVINQLMDSSVPQLTIVKISELENASNDNKESN